MPVSDAKKSVSLSIVTMIMIKMESKENSVTHDIIRARNPFTASFPGTARPGAGQVTQKYILFMQKRSSVVHFLVSIIVAVLIVVQKAYHVTLTSMIMLEGTKSSSLCCFVIL